MISKTDRIVCGTCVFWTGAREPVFDANGNPKVRIDDACGECENELSRFCGQQRNKDAKCGKFSKWTKIL